MQSVKLVLGGRDFEVVELPSRMNAAWRQKLQETVSGALGKLGQAQNVEIRNLEEASALLRDVMSLITSSPDVLVELLLEYAPTIAKAWPELKDLVYDSEMMEAFGKVFKLAFPFGSLVQPLARLIASGGATEPTSANSR